MPLSARSVSAVPSAARVQAEVTLAETLGINRLSPDYYALQLGNNVLGEFGVRGVFGDMVGVFEAQRAAAQSQ